MADAAVSAAARGVVIAAASAAIACGGAGQEGDRAAGVRARAALAAGGWGVRSAPRAHVALALPDAAAWELDDRGGDVVGAHARTNAKLVVRQTREHEVVGRDQCESRARALGLVPEGTRLRTVDTTAVAAPGELDTRVWVAVDPGEAEGAPVTGYVLAFGGHLRRCLLVRYETRVPSSREEAELAARLAEVKERLVPGIALTDPREDVPRAAPLTEKGLPRTAGTPARAAR